MKTRYILIALAAALMSSCTVDENSLSDSSTGERNPNLASEPIVVSARVASSPASRGGTMIPNSEALLATGDSLSLYSLATFSGSSTSLVNVLDNVPMWYSAGSWTYSPLQRWFPSADKYDFFACYPYVKSRLAPDFAFPSESDYYMMSLQSIVYPMYETWGAQDYAKGNVVAKHTHDLYLSKPLEDFMFGEKTVSSSGYGSAVSIPLKHATSAVRFSLRNLSETPFTLTDWYVTGLKNHMDMGIYIIGCDDEYDPLRFMSVLQEKEIDSIRISTLGSLVPDSLLLKDATNWTICADGNVKPGQTGYYDYVLLSSPLKEKGTTFGLSHIHNSDGSISYIAGPDTCRTLDSLYRHEIWDTAVKSVKAKYCKAFPHYSQGIFWGPSHGLCTDRFFIPLAYRNGPQIIDFNGDQVRGDVGDYSLKIHQFECRSKMFMSGEKRKANGGIYMPVSADNYANLYSPYFFNAGKFATINNDWHEGMIEEANKGEKRLTQDESSFRVTFDDANPITPIFVDTCIARANRSSGADYYSTSVRGGDLSTALNDSGHVLFYPQSIDSLVFNFYTCTATDASVSGEAVNATYSNEAVLHSFRPADYTPDRMWKSGYSYNYVITVSSANITVQLDVEPWDERKIDLK